MGALASATSSGMNTSGAGNTFQNQQTPPRDPKFKYGEAPKLAQVDSPTAISAQAFGAGSPWYQKQTPIIGNLLKSEESNLQPANLHPGAYAEPQNQQYTQSTTAMPAGAYAALYRMYGGR